MLTERLCQITKKKYFKFQHLLADMKVTKQIVIKDTTVVYHLHRETGS